VYGPNLNNRWTEKIESFATVNSILKLPQVVTENLPFVLGITHQHVTKEGNILESWTHRPCLGKAHPIMEDGPRLFLSQWSFAE